MKGGIGFLIGLLTGGAIATGTTYVVTKRNDVKKAEKEAEEIRNYYISKYHNEIEAENKLENGFEEVKKEEKNEFKDWTKERDTVSEGAKKIENATKEYVDYSSFSKKYVSNNVSESDIEREKKSAEMLGAYPEQLTESEYEALNDEDFDKFEYTYYEEDGWFVNYDENIAEETEQYFGMNLLAKFDENGYLYCVDKRKKRAFKIAICYELFDEIVKNGGTK